LLLCFCLAFGNTRLLQVPHPAFEPVSVELSKTIDQDTGQDASEQNFCRFIQFAAPFSWNANILARLELRVMLGDPLASIGSATEPVGGAVVLDVAEWLRVCAVK
jgi:hypothetical protein